MKMSDPTCRMEAIKVSRFMDAPVLDAALAYANERVSIIPVASDDTKIPLLPWKPYQRQAATPATVERWFTRVSESLNGVVTGKPNGILVAGVDTADDANPFPQLSRCSEHSVGLLEQPEASSFGSHLR